MRTRIAARNDVPGILKLLDRQHKYHEEIRPDLFCFVPMSSESVFHILASENEDIIVAENNGTMVGMVQLRFATTKDIPILVKKSFVYIQEMYVSDGSRRKGIGSKLLDATKSWALKRGATYLRTSCLPNNPPALEFYDKEGFTTFMHESEMKIGE